MSKPKPKPNPNPILAGMMGKQVKASRVCLYPIQSEMRYVSILEEWCRETCSMIRDEVAAIIPDIMEQRNRELGLPRLDWKDIPLSEFEVALDLTGRKSLRHDALPSAWGWTVRMSDFMKRSASRAIESVSAKFRNIGIRKAVSSSAKKVSDFNRRQWHGVLRKHYGVDVVKSEPWLAARLADYEQRNLALIESIPKQYVEKLQGQITEAVTRGYTVNQVVALVLKTYPLPLKRARLIARDQVGKLNGQLTRLRQEALGVTGYTWRGVMDSRERPSHVAHEKKHFDWDDPPKDTGHPGEDYQCRCTAEPDLPLFDDIDWD